jgi:hypothetical protein
MIPCSNNVYHKRDNFGRGLLTNGPSLLKWTLIFKLMSYLYNSGYNHKLNSVTMECFELEYFPKEKYGN